MTAGNENNHFDTWQRRIGFTQLAVNLGLTALTAMVYIRRLSEGEPDQARFILFLIIVNSAWLTDTVISLLRGKDKAPEEENRYQRTTRDLMHIRRRLSYAALIITAVLVIIAIYKATTAPIIVNKAAESIPVIVGAVMFGTGATIARHALLTIITRESRQIGQ